MSSAAEDLRKLPARFEVILCDLWGCIHDGVSVHAPAISLLQNWRHQKRRILFLTNAPRPSSKVVAQLDRLGVPKDCYDGIASSGDVGIASLISRGLTKVGFIGSTADHEALLDAGVELLPDREASDFICTGFGEGHRNDVEQYLPRLDAFAARRARMFCLNPDLVVIRDGYTEYCAGELARVYEELGGTVERFGKPYPAMYEYAFEAARGLGAAACMENTLVIGDSVATDLHGAMNMGLEFLFVADGIEAARFAEVGPEKFFAGLNGASGSKPFAWVQRLG